MHEGVAVEAVRRGVRVAVAREVAAGVVGDAARRLDLITKALHEDVVPEVKKVALGTLRDEAFTSEVRQTLGPLVRATVMDTLSLF